MEKKVYLYVQRVVLRLYEGFRRDDICKWDGDVPALQVKPWGVQPCSSPNDTTARNRILIPHNTLLVY